MTLSGLSEEGGASIDVLDGAYDRPGRLRCQVDGGLKCVGHPVGTLGLRVAYKVYLQVLGRAGARQHTKVDLGLTHNLVEHPIAQLPPCPSSAG